MQNSKNAGGLLRYSKYTAAIFDEDGTDQGPMDISSAQNDKQARDLAKREGVKWLEINGLNQATIQILRGGYRLPIVEVHTLMPRGPEGSKRPKNLN